MKVRFCKDIVARVPIECLIEDYQMLEHARKTQNWDAVSVAMECIAQSIDQCAQIPDSVFVRPSPSSLIALGVGKGVVLHEDGSDVWCMNKKPLSEARQGGVCQCDDSCPYYQKTCQPEESFYYMEGKILYKPDVNNEEVITKINH